MKKIIICVMVTLFTTVAFGQMKGSGNLVSRKVNISEFDKVLVEDVVGHVDIEIGKSWSISVVADDNIMPLLEFEQNSGKYALRIYFRDNPDNSRYIEDTHVKISITMPEASVITNDSNAKISVKNIVGRYLKLLNEENGNIEASGKVDLLDVFSAGNGNVKAGSLDAKTAIIRAKGNGDVVVRATENITAKTSGNGDVRNLGKAKYSSDSAATGNGNLL